MAHLSKAEWAALLPHADAMCLLDEVVAWDPRSLHARAASHRRGDNPLRTDGRLHAVALCEYAAQAMALHGALNARAAGAAPRRGYLVALRDVRLAVDRVDDLAGRLQVHVEALLATADSHQYAFRIEHRGLVLAAGRAAAVLRGDAPPGRADSVVAMAGRPECER